MYAAVARSLARPAAIAASASAMRPTAASAARTLSSHSDENLSYDDFTKKYVSFFEKAEDLFEVQRGLNNAFSYDLVPSTDICESALRACRRVNDYPTAVRLFEGLRQKCPSESQYKQYLDALEPLRAELGVETREELGL